MQGRFEQVGGEGEGSTPQHIQALVSQAALRLDRRQPQVAREMSDLITREIKSLDVDQSLLELLHASVDANTKTITHILLNDIPIERLQPTTAAVEYALRLAQREIPANSLIRAYSVGKDDLIGEIFPDVQALDCSAEDKFKVLQHMSRVVGRYVDWISQYVFDVYEKERERWLSTQGNVRASLVHDVLSGRNIDAREFERGTGYKLDLHHVGMVIWTIDTDPAPDELRILAQVVSEVSTAVGCSAAPLILAVDRETAWAWLPFGARPSALDTEQIRRIVGQARTCRASLGLSGAGVAGFRRTHVQGQAARRVAMTSGETPPAVGFGDEGIAISALLAENIEFTREWVAEILGSLARDNENMGMLRETLRVFFLTGESYTETARLTNLHRNTIKYRVTKALKERSNAIAANRVDLAVALNVCHFLGLAVLDGPAVDERYMASREAD
jgi:hypothetical protein